MAYKKLRCGLPPHEKVFGYKGIQQTLREEIDVKISIPTAIRYCEEYNIPRYKINARNFFVYKDEIVKSFYGAYSNANTKEVAIDDNTNPVIYPLHTRKKGK